MKASFILPTLALAFQAVAGSPALIPRESKTFKIDSVTYGGTGCAQGSMEPVIKGNKVYLDGHFTASLKSGGSVVERRRNCQVGISITFGAGWKQARVLTTYSGELNLNESAKGTLSQTYYVAGLETQGKADRTFTGPINTGYYLISNVAIPSAGKTTCGGSSDTLNLNTATLLEGDVSKGATGTIYVDFAGAELTVDVDWLEC